MRTPPSPRGVVQRSRSRIGSQDHISSLPSAAQTSPGVASRSTAALTTSGAFSKKLSSTGRTGYGVLKGSLFCSGDRRGDAVVLDVEAPRPAAVVDRAPRIHERVAAVRVEVVAGAAARIPDRPGEPLVDALVERRLDVVADVDAAEAAVGHRAQCLDDVVHLVLHDYGRRRVAVADVRAEQHEEVGVAGDDGSHVAARASLPALGERPAGAVAYEVGDRHIKQLEAGA